MDNDRPPIIHIISRETGEERCPLVTHSDKASCQGLLAEAVPPDQAIVYSDEYRSYHGLSLQPALLAERDEAIPLLALLDQATGEEIAQFLELMKQTRDV